MFGIDERALRVAWTVFLFALVVACVCYIRDTLLLFALAIVFAYMLWPVVGLVERLMPRRRNLALAVVYCVLVGALVLIGFEIVPEIGQELMGLSAQIPSLISGNKLANIPFPHFLEPFHGQLLDIFGSQVGNVRNHVLPFLQQAGTKILSGLGALLPMILIPILAFFLLKDSEQIRVTLIGVMETGHDRTLMQRILDDIHLVLKSYIRTLVLLAVIAFVAWVAFLTLLRYPYPLLLAACGAVGEFIPVIGPVSALAIMLIVCAVTGTSGLLWLIIFWGFYRLFADYVLNPYLMSSGIELHPLLVLFGVLAGDAIGGVPGMFFSIPAIAILRVLYNNIRMAYTEKKLTPDVGALKIVRPDDIPGGLHVNPQK